MTNGSNNIQFLAVAGGSILKIVGMFLGRRNWAGGSFNCKTDPNTYESLYIPSNEQEAHYILSDWSLVILLETENLGTQEEFDEGKAKLSC